MQTYYADFHVHIGRTDSGRPVKITGANTLTMPRIMQEASERKGIDMVGVIDSHVPEVLTQLKTFKKNGIVTEHEEGGIKFGQTTVLLGSEIEVNDDRCLGPVHVLAFLPYLEAMEDFSVWLSQRVTNVTLSTQRFFGNMRELQEKVRDLDGLFIPAHIFTPFKSTYGVAVRQSLTEIYDPKLIDAVELGLSANTEMADQIEELHRFSFLTNSDAHSLPKIGREYQTLQLSAPTFEEWRKALIGEGGRGIQANYGLDPLLGKYHRTCCSSCFSSLDDTAKPCPACGEKRIIKGVFDRLQEIKDSAENSGPERPPYIHQVPLEFIPGLGPKTLEKLLDHFGTEMNVLHEASFEALAHVTGERVARYIALARDGKLVLETGGAGRYGKVKKD